MPRPTVRPATLRDLDHLVRQRRAMWKDLGVGTRSELDDADEVYRTWIRKRMKNGTLAAWVAEADGEVVGGGAVWLQPVQPRPGWPEGVTPYLLSMYTDPAWRGRGVAKKVVRAAIAWAKERGYPRMTLHASDQGRPVYEGLGFHPTREMKLQLRPETVTRARRKRKPAKKATAARPKRRSR